ncbi:MAG: hypothetical protein AAFO07_30810, partial [Bacteroidota bacterium]
VARPLNHDRFQINIENSTSLYTIEYKKCVDFYQNIIGLKELFSTASLTCFEFGDSYLMAEVDDVSSGVLTKGERSRTA